MKLTPPQSADEWAAYYHCRWETLRAPWGHPEGSEQADDDKSSFHVMAMDGEIVCGVSRMHFLSTGILQIRFMGVREGYRKKGVGSRLIAYLENLAIEKEGREIMLHARESAIPFYEKSGYRIIEKSHLLWGEIQHYKMSKQLI